MKVQSSWDCEVDTPELFVRNKRESVIKVNGVCITRTGGRWRIGGGFTSVHNVVKALIGWHDSRCSMTERDIEICVSFVDCIGELLDQISPASRQLADELFQRKVLDYIEKSKQISEQSKVYVYLMKHSNGLTKIGHSVNPKAREKTLQAEDPRLRMIGVVEGSKELEKRLHEVYNTVRVRGEWFDIPEHHYDLLFKFAGFTRTCEI